MMTDVNEWLKERRRIHDAATEGPWEWQSQSMPAMNGAAWNLRRADAPGIKMSVSEYQHGPGNADAIVDAHNNLPALLTAVEKVLELHEPINGLVGDPSHWECNVCGDERGPKPYPCPTVRAIEGATK
ncbi:hypothetical protein [Brevibacterium aurantiacum]|uniref:Uncharacterized protein n=1 Tax=Brevibacterium aurantiacum TaxID=273384 RepID=A0A556C3L9_BREAU|nr:hypothetical protein [Brevibacterium aurantiacum]TSI11956.1 hypothetical protein FO013_21165 [Brevibacterium aurantiacum]